MHTDKELIAAFLSNDSFVIREFYRREYPKILAHVLKNNGKKEDAKDLAQDGLISLFTNIKLGKYQSRKDVTLSTYFFQICKFKWLDTLKSAHFKRTSSINEYEQKDNLLSYEMREHEEDDTRIKSLHASINKLGDKCKKILKAFYWEKRKLSEIAPLFDFTIESAKNAKYRCLKKIRSILND